ncbi:MAG: curli assembly protein CsgF [Methylobacterium mesophilicum]|nr:curli assembly protein CsgF [Methylobacterium mesophilicum]
MMSLVVAATMVGTGSAVASELVYRPVNPSLGGDPLNGNWLLSQATAQSKDSSSSPGFSIDFPDFGGVTQPTPTPTPQPSVPGTPTTPTGN